MWYLDKNKRAEFGRRAEERDRNSFEKCLQQAKIAEEAKRTAPDALWWQRASIWENESDSDRNDPTAMAAINAIAKEVKLTCNERVEGVYMRYEDEDGFSYSVELFAHFSELVDQRIKISV